ncbi:thiamine-phosphate kinase [Pararobbsia silviterrae]|uniref:Thiamine-monophosphate kinase n=1 Tax=Pararobbsia silviterrae TaxID=1792498 RepID=A0A494XCI8_9BURK|nr:thiamine-phosphate kinase [Pararobbsia silviterrae]RKP48567.1 thiamine-phosphate kinase [Pararobbsia silviterrae]
MLNEFSLIRRYFSRHKNSSDAAILSVGDDCALLAPTPGKVLAVSTDMLVEGRHFFAGADARALGHKTLAVNLSDLAAMGATPRAFTLALALPAIDEAWLADFSDGLYALAERAGCALIGGDTTKGPLTLCVTVFGDVDAHTALRRDAARDGDDIWISGTLGDARLALGALRDEWPLDAHALDAARRAMDQPEPRLALGAALAGVAHAALDISDGLAGDLMHILERSDMSARVDLDALPRSTLLARQPADIQRLCTAAGGDDYELCFTAPVDARARIEDAGARAGVRVTRVGTITAFNAEAHANAGAARLVWTDGRGQPVTPALRGFDHFND